MRLGAAAVTSCALLLLHVSDTRGITTPSTNRTRNEQWGFSEVCRILNIISYLLAAIAVILLLGFGGTQVLLIRLRLLKLRAMKGQDEPNIYNTFQTDRQISLAHAYTHMIPGGPPPSDINNIRHSYIDILPSDSDDYLKPVCRQCSGTV